MGVSCYPVIALPRVQQADRFSRQYPLLSFRFLEAVAVPAESGCFLTNSLSSCRWRA
jgi:hypothetical protein